MNTSSSPLREKGLLSAALLYLVLPNIIFLMGWTQPWVAIPLSLLMITGCVLTVIKSSPQEEGIRQPSVPWALFAALLIAAAWVFLIGIGGQTLQRWDYGARNPIYETLVRCDWPVFDREGSYFIYYHAFILVPAILSKLWTGCSLSATPSWFIINSLWTYAGLVLIILLLHRKLGRNILVMMVICLMLSSLAEDITRGYNYAMNRWDLHDYLPAIDRHYALSPGITSQLFNTYYHAISAWLVFSLITAGQLNRQSILFVSSLLVLLSPIAALGILVLLVFLFWDEHQSDKNAWKAWALSCETAIGYLVCLCISLYYSGGATPVSFALAATLQTTQLAPTFSERLLSLLCHISLTVAMVYITLGRRALKHPMGKAIYTLLIVCPFIYVGHLFNEMLFKIAAVTFFAFAYLLTFEWVQASRRKRIVIALLVFASSGTQLSYLAMGAIHIGFDAQSLERNYNHELQGHLNHSEISYSGTAASGPASPTPQRPQTPTSIFFGKTPPSSIYLTESGASAQGLLKWCATGNRADTETLPPDYYPQSLNKGGEEP